MRLSIIASTLFFIAALSLSFIFLPGALALTKEEEAKNRLMQDRNDFLAVKNLHVEVRAGDLPFPPAKAKEIVCEKLKPVSERMTVTGCGPDDKISSEPTETINLIVTINKGMTSPTTYRPEHYKQELPAGVQVFQVGASMRRDGFRNGAYDPLFAPFSFGYVGPWFWSDVSMPVPYAGNIETFTEDLSTAIDFTAVWLVANLFGQPREYE